jgi:uncharacterized protein (TIGR00730 family)
MDIQKVCVYCASSRQAHPEYYQAARELGSLLASAGVTIAYGGGSVGAMGALAEGALGAGGRIIGLLPEFMKQMEWGHLGLTELRIVSDMHERKRLMIEEVDAVIALPGGSGTLEELLEAITWKRLGLFASPIVLVNTRRFFDPLLALLESAVRERFMDPRHRQMWQVVDRPQEVLEAIRTSPPWDADARSFAAI